MFVYRKMEGDTEFFATILGQNADFPLDVSSGIREDAVETDELIKLIRRFEMSVMPEQATIEVDAAFVASDAACWDIVETTKLDIDALFLLCDPTEGYPDAFHLRELYNRAMQDPFLMDQMKVISTRLMSRLMAEQFTSMFVYQGDGETYQEPGVELRKILIQALSGVTEDVAAQVATGMYNSRHPFS